MKIIVDAFGGDHAPLAVIEGCRQAVDELGAEILLTGDEEKIRQAAAEAKISLDGMEIVHAPSVIPVEEDPPPCSRSMLIPRWQWVCACSVRARARPLYPPEAPAPWWWAPPSLSSV